MPTVAATNNGSAGALFQSAVQAAGVDLSHLSPLAQVQLAVAQLFTSDPTTINIPAGDVLAGTFGANKAGGADSGAYTFPGALRVNGAASLGTAAGADQTIIDGTGFGAGVASLRLNGLTTAAVTNQTGTLTNAPVSGNPTFWAPVSIAGVVKYIPCW